MTYYATPGAQAQPVNFMSGVGNFFGNLGNSWQGASDAPMYGGGQSPGGGQAQYATVTGATVATNAVASGATDLYNQAAGGVSSLFSNVFGSAEKWILIGGIFILVVALSPTINNLSDRRR
jgi:hypothetical protein